VGGPKKGGHMRIKVQYDAGTRTFKLVDQGFRTILEGDALYDLQIPLSAEEVAEVEEYMPPPNVFIAHA
jgi:hypothetical protein